MCPARGNHRRQTYTVTAMMDTLSSMFGPFGFGVEPMNSDQYWSEWAVETSGSRFVSCHMVTRRQCYFFSNCLSEIVALGTDDLVLFPHDERHVIAPKTGCSVELNALKPRVMKRGLEPMAWVCFAAIFALLTLPATPAWYIARSAGQT